MNSLLPPVTKLDPHPNSNPISAYFQPQARLHLPRYSAEHLGKILTNNFLVQRSLQRADEMCNRVRERCTTTATTRLQRAG